jgi:hypothetical protein
MTLDSPMVGSFGLEALGGELQGAAILGDGADDVVGGPAGDLGLDFEGDGDLVVDDAGEVGDDLLGDTSGVAGETGGVEGEGAVEPLGPGGLGLGRDRRRGPRPGSRPRRGRSVPGGDLRSGRHNDVRLGSVGVELGSGDGALDEQAGRVGVAEGDVLAAAEATVAGGADGEGVVDRVEGERPPLEGRQGRLLGGGQEPVVDFGDAGGDGSVGGDSLGLGLLDLLWVEVEDELFGEDGLPGEVVASGLVEVLEAGLVGGEEDEGVAVEPRGIAARLEDGPVGDLGGAGGLLAVGVVAAEDDQSGVEFVGNVEARGWQWMDPAEVPLVAEFIPEAFKKM